MPHLLLELFSEEIPARMQLDALNYLCSELAEDFKNHKMEGFVTPRRLAVFIYDLPEKQGDKMQQIKGPKTNAPDAALDGFLKKHNVIKNDLIERDGSYFLDIKELGKPTTQFANNVIEKLLSDFPWPKSMRWGSRDETWVRPLHSIVCILGSDVVPVEFAGIKASNVTYGHRFLAPERIQINDASEYVEKLEQAYVIADREKRKTKIQESLEKKAATIGLVWQQDNALLEEVVGLVEWPVIMFGKVDEQFMHLPPELLTTVMRSHQKYFTLNDTAGRFSSTFAFAANRDTATHGKEIIAGNERVLRARFSDAKFFFEQDQKKTLADWNAGLEKVTFHAKIGTVAEKVKRIKNISKIILYDFLSEGSPSLTGSDSDKLIIAANICKADLVTGMVGEFPELQGIMGSYYARAEGKSEAVCEALYHLYDLPKDLKKLGVVEQILCIADRLDTLISLFAIGEKPTGSKDPYALRRAALGVIAVIRNHNLRIDINYLLAKLQWVYNTIEKEKDFENVILEILEFLNDRLEADLLEQGVERTTLRAIGGLMQDGDMVRVEARAKALQAFLKTPESEAMLAAYKRANNILSIEQKKDGKIYRAEDLSDNRFKEEQEKRLFAALSHVSEKIKPLVQEEQYKEVMELFVTLKQPLDQFFADIMVNADVPELRENRLCLLAAIVKVMNEVADFSKITD